MDLAELIVKISADVKPINTAIDGVKARLNSLKPTFDAVQRGAASVFLGITGAFAASAAAAGDAERADTLLATALRQTLDTALETSGAVDKLAKSYGTLEDAIKDASAATFKPAVPQAPLIPQIDGQPNVDVLTPAPVVNAAPPAPIIKPPKPLTIDVPPATVNVDVPQPSVKITPPEPTQIVTPPAKVDVTAPPPLVKVTPQKPLTVEAPQLSVDVVQPPAKVNVAPAAPVTVNAPQPTVKVNAPKPITINAPKASVTVKADPAKVSAAAYDAIKKELDAYAVSLQRVTVYGDDFIKEQMAMALNLGVTADQLKAVTQLGIGLGQSFFGGDAAAGIDAMAKAQQGNFRALQKLIPELKNATSDTEKLAIVQARAERGFVQARAQANTFTGSLKQLWENVGDVAEVFGGILTPSLKMVNQYLSAVAVSLQTLSPAQQQSIVKWAAITAAIAGTIMIAPRVLSAFALIGSTITAVSGLIVNVGVAAFKALRLAIATTWAVAAANPFTVALAAVAALATGIAYLGGTGDTAFERITNGFANFNAATVNAWNRTVQFIRDTWSSFASAFVASLGSTFDSLKEAFDSVVTYWAGVLNSFGAFVRDTFGGVYTTSVTVLGAVASAFGTAFGFIAGIVGEVVGYIGSLFTEGFGIIGGIVGDFASVFAKIGGTMFGSWRGFVQGLVTLWNQTGFVLIKGWQGVKAMFLDVWEDVKHAGTAVFYHWGGVVAEFAANTMSAFQRLVAYVKNIWNNMVDMIADSLAEVAVKVKVTTDIGEEFGRKEKLTEADTDKLAARQYTPGRRAANMEQAERTVAERMPNASAAERRAAVDEEFGALQQAEVSKLKAQMKAQYEGRALTEQEMMELAQSEANIRLADLRRNAQKERESRQQEYTERLTEIDKANDGMVAQLRKWSEDGLSKANTDRDSGKATNNAEREKEIKAIEAARLADLAKDLEKMKGMPKLSERAEKALSMIRKGLDFSKVREYIKGLIDGFDKEKLDADKNLKLDRRGLQLGDAAQLGQNGTSIEEAFKANLRKQVMPGAIALSKENEKRREEAARKEAIARQKEQHRATEKNTKTTDDNTNAVRKLSDAIEKYGIGGGQFGLA